MHKPLVVAALSALALGGATFAGSAGAQTPILCSHPNEHCILVTVDKDSTGAPKLFVDAEELRVKGPLHLIFWRLNNASGQKYTFPSDGIAFKTADGRAEFTCAPFGPTGLIFKCTDPNKTQGKFEYAVKVNGAPGVPVLDPWVINQ